MRTGLVLAGVLALAVLLWLARTGARGAPARGDFAHGTGGPVAPAPTVEEAPALVPAPRAREPLAVEAESEPLVRWVEDAWQAGGLTGIVREPDGAPASNAAVRFAWDGGVVETRTDSSGAFALAAEEGVRGDLLASVLPTSAFLSQDTALERFVPAVLTGVVGGTRGLELRLGAPDLLTLEVVSSRGGTPGGVFPTFAWQLAGRAVEDGAPSSNPPFRWPRPPVPFFVEVYSNDHRPARVGPFDPARVGPVITVVLDPLPRVRGRVVREGAGVPGARIAFQATEPTAAAFFAGSRSVVTDADGAFDAVQPGWGRFVLHAIRVPLGEGHSEPITLDGHGDVEDVVIELAGALGRIEGRVLLPPGHGPEGLCMMASSAPRVRRALHADGSFVLSDLPGGPCTVSLLAGGDVDPKEDDEWNRSTVLPTSAPEWLGTAPTYEVDVRPGETTRLDIDLADPTMCRLAGTIRIDGRPPPVRAASPDLPGILHAPAVQLDAGGRDTVQSATDLDARGAFELSALGPGKYRFTAELAMEGARETWRIQDEVLLRQGLVVPWDLDVATGSLAVRVTDRTPLAGLAVVWKGEDGPTVSVRFPAGDEDRTTAVFERVPAGRVRLERAGGKSSDGIELQITAGRRTTASWPR